MLRCTDNWICSLPFNKNTFCLSWYWAPDRGEETEWPNPIKPCMNPFDWLQLVRLDLKILQNDIKDTKFSIATCATYLWIHFAICLSENPSCLAPSKCSYETSAAYKGTNAHTFQLLFWKKKNKQTNIPSTWSLQSQLSPSLEINSVRPSEQKFLVTTSNDHSFREMT